MYTTHVRCPWKIDFGKIMPAMLQARGMENGLAGKNVYLNHLIFQKTLPSTNL